MLLRHLNLKQMKIQLVAIVICSFCGLSLAKAQTLTDWSKTKNWKLYKIQDNMAFNYSPDTLQHFSQVALAMDLLTPMLQQVTPLKSQEAPLWMGFYVVSFEDQNGQTRKAEVSMYGGFLYEDASKKYFVVPEAIRRSWLDFMNHSANRLFDQ